jgi:uncharacterized protein
MVRFFSEVLMVISLKELSDQVANCINKTISAEKIIIFGSYARGEQTSESDLDVMVVCKDDPNSHGVEGRRKKIAKIAKALRIIPLAKDIVLFSESEVEEWKSSENHMIAKAQKDGIEIYARF